MIYIYGGLLINCSDRSATGNETNSHEKQKRTISDCPLDDIWTLYFPISDYISNSIIPLSIGYIKGYTMDWIFSLIKFHPISRVPYFYSVFFLTYYNTVVGVVWSTPGDTNFWSTSLLQGSLSLSFFSLFAFDFFLCNSFVSSEYKIVNND